MNLICLRVSMPWFKFIFLRDMLTGGRMKNLQDYGWQDQILLSSVASWKMVDYQASKYHNDSQDVKLHKVIQGLLPFYLQTYHNHNAVSEGASITCSTTQNGIKPIPARTKVFENWFFPYSIKDWSKVNDKIRNIEYKSEVTILNFIRFKRNSYFSIHDTNRIKLLSGLRLNFSHLNEREFRHNFNDTVDPMCTCGPEPETKLLYLLHYNLYSTQKLELLNNVYIPNPSLKISF